LHFEEVSQRKNRH